MTRRLVIEDAEPGIITIHGHEFSVRIGADLDTNIVTEIIRLSTEQRRFGLKPDKVAEWADRAKELILKVIEKEDPDPAALDEIKRRSLSVSALAQTLRFLLQNPNGIEAEVAEALTDGARPAPEGAGPTDPQISRKRSRSRSSRSVKGSGSSRDTGEDSDGATSVSTSRTPIAAA